MRDKVKANIREWAESIAVAVVLAFLIRTFVIQAFKIPTGSMEQTLMPGDKIMVNKLIYHFREPQRGDVIVFKFPENPRRDFVKRLAARGGESISIKNGNIYINGQKSDIPELQRYYYNFGPYGAPGAVITVPEKHYFVLGDNSKSSNDSRYWGFVPRKNLIGRASFIWWPPWRIGKIR
jgi:signal peptidase I